MLCVNFNHLCVCVLGAERIYLRSTRHSSVLSRKLYLGVNERCSSDNLSSKNLQTPKSGCNVQPGCHSHISQKAQSQSRPVQFVQAQPASSPLVQVLREVGHELLARNHAQRLVAVVDHGQVADAHAAEERIAARDRALGRDGDGRRVHVGAHVQHRRGGQGVPSLLRASAPKSDECSSNTSRIQSITQYKLYKQAKNNVSQRTTRL